MRKTSCLSTAAAVGVWTSQHNGEKTSKRHPPPTTRVSNAYVSYVRASMTVYTILLIALLAVQQERQTADLIVAQRSEQLVESCDQSYVRSTIFFAWLIRFWRCVEFCFLHAVVRSLCFLVAASPSLLAVITCLPASSYNFTSPSHTSTKPLPQTRSSFRVGCWMEKSISYQDYQKYEYCFERNYRIRMVLKSQIMFYFCRNFLLDIIT